MMVFYQHEQLMMVIDNFSTPCPFAVLSNASKPETKGLVDGLLTGTVGI